MASALLDRETSVIYLRVVVAASYLGLAWYLWFVLRWCYCSCTCRKLVRDGGDTLGRIWKTRGDTLGRIWKTLRCALVHTAPEDPFEAQVFRVERERRLQRAVTHRLLFMHLILPFVVWEAWSATSDGIWTDFAPERVKFYIVRGFPGYVMLLASCLVIITVPRCNTPLTLNVLYVLQFVRIMFTIDGLKGSAMDLTFYTPLLGFVRFLLSWMVENSALATIMNGIFCAVNCWAYCSAVSTDPEAGVLASPAYVRMFLTREVVTVIAIAFFSYSYEKTRLAEVRATLDSKSHVKLALTIQGLLSVLCDVVVHLGPDFRVHGANPHLATFLLSGKSGKHFDGCSFTALMRGTDGERFKEHVARGHPDSHTQSLNVVFKGAHDTEIQAKLHHSSHEAIDGKLKHIVGISELRSFEQGAESSEVGSISCARPPQFAVASSRGSGSRSSQSDKASSKSNESSRDLVASLPQAYSSSRCNVASLHTLPIIEVSCILGYESEDVLNMQEYSIGFALLCGSFPQGLNLLDWIEERKGFLTWVQNAGSCFTGLAASRSELSTITVTLQPPSAKQLKMEFVSVCNVLSFELAEQTGPMIRLSFTQVHQSKQRPSYSTKAAVLCNAFSHELTVRQSTFGFRLLSGADPAGASLTEYMKDSQSFKRWVQDYVNTLLNTVEKPNAPKPTRQRLRWQSPFAKELGIELSSTCTLQVEDDLAGYSAQKASAEMLVRVSFKDTIYYTGSSSENVNSEGPPACDTYPLRRRKITHDT